MNIKVIGSGCDKCTKLYKNTLAAAEQLNLDADIEKIEDLMDIVRLGVMTTPAVMADGKIIVSGQVPNVKEMIRLLANFKNEK